MSRIRTFAQYQKDYQLALDNPEDFWAEQASEFLWKKPWDTVLQGWFEKMDVQWFVWGQLNITENCLDRHLPEKAHNIAYYWEPNLPTDAAKQITYQELFDEVCKFSNVLKKYGVKKGDRVCLYMPLILESIIAMLACARIGAIHSVVFGGFSAQALAERICDADCKIVITTDGGFRGTKVLPIKATVDETLSSCPWVGTVIVCEHAKIPYTRLKWRDIVWQEEISNVSNICPAEPMESEDPLFILYTSGSTGKPKGVVHTCGGYMVYAQYSFENVFQYNPGEVYWCTADIGWITGHSYGIYGPLLSGASSVVFEGIPTYPDAGRFWEIIDKYSVNIFYTAPTAIRALMAFGLDFITPYTIDSLRVLGSVWEPLNEEAWHWYHEHIGKKRCPIVDTWWQTETGGILISPLAGITPTKPSFAILPLPGIQPLLVDEYGKEISGDNISGNLCIRSPWPSMIRTIYGDHARCQHTYFSNYPGLYFTGDGCLRDENGYYRITGRMDDVLNISGHRIGTAEVENAINSHPNIIESAVVGYPHAIKGQGMYAYIVVTNNAENLSNLEQEIFIEVKKNLWSFAQPDIIQFVSQLPKTRSGKIMRRILRKIADGETDDFWDTSTLLDPGVVEEIKRGAELLLLK